MTFGLLGLVRSVLAGHVARWERTRLVAGSSPASSLGATTEPSHIVADSADVATNEEEQDAGEAT